MTGMEWVNIIASGAVLAAIVSTFAVLLLIRNGAQNDDIEPDYLDKEQAEALRSERDA